MPHEEYPFENPKLDLVMEHLRSGATARLAALGNSMLPTLWPGDVLTIQSAGPEEVVPGDIVLVVRNGRPYVHRLMKKIGNPERPELILRGDAMPQDDPPTPAAQLLGKVCGIERNHRLITPKKRIGPISRLLALALCHWDTFRNLALRIHSLRRGNPVRGSSQKARDNFAGV